MQAGAKLKSSAIVVCTLLLGWQVGREYERRVYDIPSTGTMTGSGSIATDPEQEANIGNMWGVWKLLLAHYVHPTDLETNKLVTGAVRGMVEAVGDPYTVYMTTKESQQFAESLDGHLEGIGAQLADREGHTVVVAPVKGSPAEKAGLRSQDIITTVDGVDIAGMPLDDVVTRIRGKKGTTVKLQIIREGKVLEFSIVRDEIQVPSVEFSVKEDSGKRIGVLTLSQFGSDTIREAREYLQSAEAKGISGLIVDLRNNGGGYLDAAVDLVSFFVKSGTVVSVVDRNGTADVKSVNGRPLLPELPMVVLINQGSASASEIAAGALQDSKRATIIGQQSFGKGTVQEVFDLPDGSSVKITIAKWLTPNGKDLGKAGVTPDFVINQNELEFVSGKDPQMNVAVALLARGVKPQTGTGSVR